MTTNGMPNYFMLLICTSMRKLPLNFLPTLPVAFMDDSHEKDIKIKAKLFFYFKDVGSGCMSNSSTPKYLDSIEPLCSNRI